MVTVARERGGQNIWLANNGKVDASTETDRDTQVLLAHLPFAFRPDADRALVIGFASGITTGSIVLHDKPTTIDVVEIEPAVLEASREFEAVNHRPLEDPRVHVFLNDARHHLILARDGSYDLVSSEPSNPWITGVSNLFTREQIDAPFRSYLTSARALLRARSLEGLVGNWDRSDGLPPVLRPRLASGLLRVPFRLVLGEGCGLALASAP